MFIFKKFCFLILFIFKKKTSLTLPFSFLRGDFVSGGGGGMVVLSQSGETKDCHRAVVLGGEAGMVCFSIVNAVRFVYPYDQSSLLFL